jgi:hypothetical protein
LRTKNNNNFFTSGERIKKREKGCGGRGEEMGELCEYITRFWLE